MPTTSTSNGAPPAVLGTSAEAVVRSFLELLAADDLDGALALLAEDVVYTNVGLPTVRGRHVVDRLFRPALGRAGFKVHFDHVVSDGRVVLTERVDALVFGPVHWQFWVYGRFEVVEGKITVWRDSFDYVDVNIGLLRGLVGAVVPGVRRRWPS